MTVGQLARFRERWRRTPRWLRVTLLVVVALVLLVGIFGNREPATGQQAAGTTPPATSGSSTTASSPPSSMVTTTSTPPPPPTVREIVDARTVALSTGERVTVDSLAVPGECWRDPAVEFTRTTLLGKQVQVVTEAGRPIALRLVDGTDFATLAVSQGLGRAASAGSPLGQAQDTARQAGLGLWGEPCRGQDVLPAVTPPPEATPAQPTRQPDPPVVQQQPEAVYYANCTQAKAAGAAPLHRGEPGYRAGLDRDGDGVACES